MIPHMTPEQLRDALARIAEGEVGVKEEGGANKGKRIQEYQRATWLDGTGWPWCAAFICWAVREWVRAPAVLAGLKMDATAAERWRPKTAGAWDFVRWANEHGAQVVDENMSCRRGDIVVFDFSHIGLVVEDSSRGQITTVEGNTNGAGSRDGDGVWKKHRERSLVKRFIRLV